MLDPKVPSAVFPLPSHSSSSIAVTLEKACVAYKNRIALKDLTGQIKKSSLTAIVGPNGGGKSSFLKALLGVVPLTAGKLHFYDNLKHSIAYLPQQCAVDQNFPLTVRDVVTSGHCQRHGFFRGFKTDLLDCVNTALDQVGMLDCHDRSLHTLSGGQFQRVLFARLIIQNADIILLDEPFTAIDSYTTSDLIKIIESWQQMGKTVLIVCHDLDLVESHFPETILLAQQVLAWGQTSNVLTSENMRLAKKIAATLESEHPTKIDTTHV